MTATQLVKEFIVPSSRCSVMEAIEAIKTPKIFTLQKTLNDGQTFRLTQIQECWEMGLLWLLKHQSKAFRKKEPPFNDPSMKAVESWGNLLNAELELWNACLDFVDEFNPSNTIPYRNAVEGWMLSMIDLKQSDFNAIFEPKTTKDKIQEGISSELEKLEAWENPYDPNNPIETHHYNLIEIAIAIGKPRSSGSNKLRSARKKFRDGAWENYLASYRIWKSALHHDKRIAVVYVKDGKVYEQLEGRRHNLLSPQTKSFLKAKRKKRNHKDP